MILFVDDEKREMDSYVRELELSGHAVAFHKDVDEAWKFLEANKATLVLLILDIMMPPGSIFKDMDTGKGLRTGIRFYERARDKAPNLPVIILTNVSDERVAERFRTENQCWFLRKEDYLPIEFVGEVDRILTQKG